MKISLEWISLYVDISGVSPQTVADRLTMSTAEVEGVQTLTRCLKGVRVGKVLSVEPLADGQKLARVQCGPDCFTTVCGAPNVREGMKSAFAPAGVQIAGGQPVGVKEFSGHTSQGILCSSNELGMGGGHFGILEIPDGVENGALLADLIPPSDTVIEIDNKSLTHRPDLWGHYGFAREVAAIFGRRLQPLELADLSIYHALPPYPLEIEDLENCPCYGCLEMGGVAVVPAPLAIQYRLHALGQRTFNILVDLTNYIMLELGQPMHAFDGSRLQAVRVAPLGSEGSFTTLDGQTRQMLPADLMIWNEKEPVALAGIMGGLNSEVDTGTAKLLLESANFKDARIRRTATRLGIQTDASQRFEKQQPPINTKTSIERFLHLMQASGMQPQILSRFTYSGDLKEAVRRLEIPKDFFNRRIGNPISNETIVSILTSLGFAAEVANGTVKVGIPPFRSEKDISLPVDILEEVTRINGYDNLEPKMPDFLVDKVSFNDRLRTEHKARRLLAQAHGFTEIHNYSWFDESWLQTIGYQPGPTLEVTNPSAEQYVRLQTTLIPNILAAVKKNGLLRDRLQVFELGRGYFPAGESACQEVNFLSGASLEHERIAPLEDHFRSVKGTLEALAQQLNVGAFEFEPAKEGTTPWQIPGCFVHIQLQDQVIGSLGFLTGPLLAEIASQSQIVWFEIDFDRLQGPIFPETGYEASSRYPGSWFDFSIVASPEAGFVGLVRLLDEFSHPLLKKRDFITLYKGQGLEQGMGSYTFRYWIESKERTLTGEEIEAFQQEYLEFLKSKGLSLR